MNEEELYELAISDVSTYSLLNEILAIRDKRFPNEEVDYCININGYISLDVLNKYVKVVQENQQLKIQLLEKKCSDKDIEYKEKIKLQQRIDKAIEYNNQIIKDTEDFYYFGDCLIDLAERNISILKGEENE